VRPGRGDEGRILAEGPVSELSEGRAVELGLIGEAGPLAARLRGAAGLPDGEVEGEGSVLRIALAEGIDVPDLVAHVVTFGGRIASVLPAARELERVYLELMRPEGMRP
jgi:hypothetical protein